MDTLDIDLAERGVLGARARARLQPLLSDAVGAGGGLIVAVGVLLIAIDLFGDSESRAPGVVLFAALGLGAVVALFFLPRATWPACIAALVVSVPALWGFALLPSVDSFGDLRSFFALVIATWVVLWLAPHTQARPVFLAVALVVLWAWMLGEAADLGSTTTDRFSSDSGSGSVSSIDDFESIPFLGDLDPSDPLYPLAESCSAGDYASCDALADEAEPGSDFEQFGRSCGGFIGSFPASSCEESFNGGVSLSPSPFSPFGGFGFGDDDDALRTGIVSMLFALASLGAMAAFDRLGRRGLATAFVPVGLLSLLWGVAQLGDETGHAWSGGLIALASGLVLGWLGQLGERRLTTWLGGALASIGALIIAVDAATSDNAAISGDFDGVGPGIVVMLFGVAFVALAVLLAGATRRGPGGTTPPFVGATPGPAPAPADAPNAPAPWAAPPSEPPSTSQWARPPTVEVDDSPPATDPS